MPSNQLAPTSYGLLSSLLSTLLCLSNVLLHAKTAYKSEYVTPSKFECSIVLNSIYVLHWLLQREWGDQSSKTQRIVTLTRACGIVDRHKFPWNRPPLQCAKVGCTWRDARNGKELQS